MPLEMEPVNILNLLWAPSSLAGIVLIALLLQSCIASSKNDIEGSLFNLHLLGLVAVIQLSIPLYGVFYAAWESGMGWMEGFYRSVWIAFWHLSVSSLLLSIGCTVLIVYNRQQGLLKKYLPATASFLLLFVYSVFLLIAGIW